MSDGIVRAQDRASSFAASVADGFAAEVGDGGQATVVVTLGAGELVIVPRPSGGPDSSLGQPGAAGEP